MPDRMASSGSPPTALTTKLVSGYSECHYESVGLTLLSQGECDCSVGGYSAVRCWVLVLRDGSDLRVDRRLRAIQL